MIVLPFRKIGKQARVVGCNSQIAAVGQNVEVNIFTNIRSNCCNNVTSVFCVQIKVTASSIKVQIAVIIGIGTKNFVYQECLCGRNARGFGHDHQYRCGTINIGDG